MAARILIVEDVPDSRNLLHFLFTSKGFTVVTAADGNEGLYLAKAEKPALIITDYTMPDMNGAELVERLRQEEGLATVPVLIYTAYSAEDVAPAREAGAAEIFYKPFDLDKLINYVMQFAEQLPDE